MAKTKVSYEIRAKDKTKDGINSVKKNIKGVENSFKSLKVAAVGLLSAVTGGALVSGLNRLSESLQVSLKSLDDLGKTARRLSLPVEQLQKYHALAEAASISTGTFDTAFQRFARRIGQARLGTGELVKTLDILNIEFTKQDGTLKNNTELFDEFGRKISNLNDENLQLALTMSGVDTEGVKLVEMFRQTVQEQDRVIAKVKELGGFYDTQLIAKAEAYSTELGIIKAAQERLNTVSDAGMAAMIRNWENLKLDIIKARNAVLQYLGVYGITIDDSNKRLIETNTAFEEQVRLIKKSLEAETDPARIAYQKKQLEYAEKQLKVTKEQIKARIASAEGIGDLSSIKDPVENKKASLGTGKEVDGYAIQYSSLKKELDDVAKTEQKAIDYLFEANDLYNDQIITLKELQYIQEKYGTTAEWANEKAMGSEAKNSIIDWKNTAEYAIGGITNTLVDMAVEGKNSFEEFARSFLKNIAAMILQASVLKAIRSTSWGVSLIGEGANGGVVTDRDFTPFASGGIVSSPTLFSTSSGVGLMGEVPGQSEGILPLKRQSNGQLGVQADGAGGNVTQNITVTGTGDKDLIAAMARAAQEGYQLALNDARKNGPLRRTLAV